MIDVSVTDYTKLEGNMDKYEKTFFGVELTVFYELKAITRRDYILDKCTILNQSFLDYYYLSLSQKHFYEKDLFEKMHHLKYEQIQTIKTLVEIGMENPTIICDIEDLFDSKFMSLKWTGDTGREILNLIHCSYFSQGLSQGIEIIDKVVGLASIVDN